jgi:ParB/RepB/Spo0J family partition protein
MNVVAIPINEIDVSQRRRTDFGDIEGLAAGIRRVGQLEPILVDRNGSGRYRLIFGERRLRAMKSIGAATIAAQLREHLSDEQFRDIELEENDNRKSLTEGERARTFRASKHLVESAKKAAEVLSTESVGKPKPRGQQPTYGSPKKEVAAALGIGTTTLVEAEQHIATAERFPFMQGWRQSQVLAIREQLERLPEPEQTKACEVVACAKLMDPAMAVRLVTNIAAKPIKERQELYRLSASTDPRDRSLALTEAAKLPPMPDPRVDALRTAIDALKRATEPYPNDPLTPRLLAAAGELQAIRAAIRKSSGPLNDTARIQ